MEKSEIQNPKSEIKELVGAYIIDPDGNAVPDLSDEAMAARQKHVPGLDRGSEIRNPKSKIEVEVNKDA